MLIGWVLALDDCIACVDWLSGGCLETTCIVCVDWLSGGCLVTVSCVLIV